MTPEGIVDIVRHTLFVALEIAAPFLLASLIIGLLIAIFQAMTQVQEFTLTFVPKMLIVVVLLAIFFPWIMKMMTKFTHQVLVDEWSKLLTYAY